MRRQVDDFALTHRHLTFYKKNVINKPKDSEFPRENRHGNPDMDQANAIFMK